MNNQPVYTDNDPQSELVTLNLGPTHPATHGVFQNVLQLDGERIVSGVSTIGYIHRAFEKIAEHRPFYQITPLTDRLNYCSSPINNMGWHMTVEKLLNIKMPKRVDYLRIIIMELARISDWLVFQTISSVIRSSHRIPVQRPPSCTFFNSESIFMRSMKKCAVRV
jgi:NADH-quinone oxidoreductase subunit D